MTNRPKMDEIPKNRAKIPLLDWFSEKLHSLIWSDHCIEVYMTPILKAQKLF